MDLKTSLGFGFFNKTRTKGRKRSERQLADMYDKVAIRGSIQHVWGEEVPRREPAMPTAPVHEAGGRDQSDVNPESDHSTDALDDFGTLLRQQTISPELAPPLAPMFPTGRPLGATLVSPPISSAAVVSSDLQSRSPSPRSTMSAGFDLGSSGHSVVHKKFSFCPSTISLVPPRSPGANPRSPRSLSLTRSTHPYSRRSGTFSASSPSIANCRISFAQERGARQEPDDHVSIADEADYSLAVSGVSPTNSLHYSTSIISRISSVPELAKHEDPYGVQLPGQIYAPILPHALRDTAGLGSGLVGANPGYGEEPPENFDDDDLSSDISGLSEVNAGYSTDSDFDSDVDDRPVERPSDLGDKASLLTTSINPELRRDSVRMKRVSYTKLESGEYLTTVESKKRRSATPPRARTSADGSVDASTARPAWEGYGGDEDEEARGLRRQGSVASHWTIEQEFISPV